MVLHPGSDLQNQAMRWSYVLQNRARWTDGDTSAAQRDQAVALLAQLLGKPDAKAAASDLAAISVADYVEVNIPFTAEGVNWQYRVLPWEFIITAATHDARRDQRLTVARCLYRPGEPARHRRAAPGVLLHLENAPGSLRNSFDFSSERGLLKLAAADNGLRYEPHEDVSREAIAETLRPRSARRDACIIHVSGFDSHQALGLLDPTEMPRDETARAAQAARPARHARPGVRPRDGGSPEDTEHPSKSAGVVDGLVLPRMNAREVDFVRSEDVAKLLVPEPARAPWLICFNIWNSGARTAALCVADGAHAAVGFQDTFDDRLAEIFYSSFYLAVTKSNRHPAYALRSAMEVVTRQGRPLEGTGIILWCRTSLEDAARGRASAPRERAAERAPLAAELARQALDVSVTPMPALNYSILHNDGALFEKFLISRKHVGRGSTWGRVDDLEVTVTLHVGTDSFPFRMSVSIDPDETAKDLAPAIRISLASALSRSVRESIQTTLFVEVRLQRTVLYRHTHRVTLLPIDEWRDDDPRKTGRGCTKWLPSFVLPRDPAVGRIIDEARRYVTALRDDCTAGFDGYQSVDPEAASAAEACEAVDRQVQAIWFALLHEHGLTYINPPPTFTEQSQRLRSPSDIIGGKCGTCIDLALLFAACLEYVDIYPAIILLEAHAFPVYWRDATYFESFQKVDYASATGEKTTHRAGDRWQGSPFAESAQRFRWYMTGAGVYGEIMKRIRAGQLVPVETVMLTAQAGFAEAVEEGGRNLVRPSDFHSMLDVRLAREAAVTPLPVRRTEA